MKQQFSQLFTTNLKEKLRKIRISLNKNLEVILAFADDIVIIIKPL
jgi:hypothetical protein